MQTQLNDPCLIARYQRRHFAKSRTALLRVRRREVCVVRKIQRLYAELERVPLPRIVLQQRGIEAEKSRCNADRLAGVPESVGSRCREGGGIEPLRQLLGS